LEKHSGGENLAGGSTAPTSPSSPVSWHPAVHGKTMQEMTRLNGNCS